MYLWDRKSCATVKNIKQNKNIHHLKTMRFTDNQIYIYFYYLLKTYTCLFRGRWLGEVKIEFTSLSHSVVLRISPYTVGKILNTTGDSIMFFIHGYTASCIVHRTASYVVDLWGHQLHDQHILCQWNTHFEICTNKMIVQGFKGSYSVSTVTHFN